LSNLTGKLQEFWLILRSVFGGGFGLWYNVVTAYEPGDVLNYTSILIENSVHFAGVL
jgi:hypothetical protein